MVELEVKKLQSIFKTPRIIQIVNQNESFMLCLIVLSFRQLLCSIFFLPFKHADFECLLIDTNLRHYRHKNIKNTHTTNIEPKTQLKALKTHVES
jgi:hypothetical protein